MRALVRGDILSNTKGANTLLEPYRRGGNYLYRYDEYEILWWVCF